MNDAVKSPKKILIYTLPKSGTHLTKAVLSELKLPFLCEHIYEPANYELQIDATTPYMVQIRDPRGFFSSLVRWSDRRCRQGIAEDRIFPAYKNKAQFKSWLNLGIEEKFAKLITLSEDQPYPAELVRKHFEFISSNFNKDIFIKYEEIIGSNGGGCNNIQAETYKKLIEYFGHYRSKGEIFDAIQKVWGHGETFDRANIHGWRQDFSSNISSVFNLRWGNLPVLWGYEANEV